MDFLPRGRVLRGTGGQHRQGDGVAAFGEKRRRHDQGRKICSRKLSLRRISGVEQSHMVAAPIEQVNVVSGAASRDEPLEAGVVSNAKFAIRPVWQSVHLRLIDTANCRRVCDVENVERGGIADDIQAGGIGIQGEAVGPASRTIELHHELE
jgi:hypothetical protein